MGNSQTDKWTKTCLKTLDPGGQKIKPKNAWILVGKVLKPIQVNIAMERIYQEESDKIAGGPLIRPANFGQNISTKTRIESRQVRHGEIFACLKILDPGGQKYFIQKVSSDIPVELLGNFPEFHCIQKPVDMSWRLLEDFGSGWVKSIDHKNHAMTSQTNSVSNFIKVKPTIDAH